MARKIHWFTQLDEIQYSRLLVKLHLHLKLQPLGDVMHKQEEASLLYLAILGDVDALRAGVDLLRHRYGGASLKKLAQICDEFGAGLIHYAARSPHLPPLQYLASSQFGLSVRVAAEFGNTPAHDAVVSSHPENVIWLVAEAGADPLATDREGLNLLHLAAYTGQRDLTDWLLTNTACCADDRARNGATPLHFSAMKGKIDVMHSLLSWSLRSLDPDCRMLNGATPLYLACQEGHRLVAECLVDEFRADIGARTSRGLTCLHAAAQGGHLGVARWLLERRPDLARETDSSGALPIHYAASGGHLDTVAALAPFSPALPPNFLQQQLLQPSPPIQQQPQPQPQPQQPQQHRKQIIPSPLEFNAVRGSDENAFFVSNGTNGFDITDAASNSQPVINQPHFYPHEQQRQSQPHQYSPRAAPTPPAPPPPPPPPPPPAAPPPPPPPPEAPRFPLPRQYQPNAHQADQLGGGGGGGGVLQAIRNQFRKPSDPHDNLIEELKKFSTSNLKKTQRLGAGSKQVRPKSQPFDSTDGLEQQQQQQQPTTPTPGIPASRSHHQQLQQQQQQKPVDEKPQTPQWLRELRARKANERASLEAAEAAKFKEAEDRLAKLPPWKRQLLQRQQQQQLIQQQQQVK